MPVARPAGLGHATAPASGGAAEHGGVVLGDGRVFISRPPPRIPRLKVTAIPRSQRPPSSPAGSSPVTSGHSQGHRSPAHLATKPIPTAAKEMTPPGSPRHRCTPVRPSSEPGTSAPPAPQRTEEGVSAVSAGNEEEAEAAACGCAGEGGLTPRFSSSSAFQHVLWHDLFPTLVAGYLSCSDIRAVAAVCQAARRAAQLPCVWRALAVCSFGVQQPAALEALCRVRCQPSAEACGAAAEEDDPSLIPSPLPTDAHGSDVHRERVRALREMDSQMPTPCERAGSHSDAFAAAAAPTACSVPTSAKDRDCPDLTESAPLPSAVAERRDAAVACAPDASRRPFPWQGFVRLLHRGRVAELLRFLRDQERTRPEVTDAGEVEGPSAGEDAVGERESHTTLAHAECDDGRVALRTPLAASAVAVTVSTRRCCVERLTYSIHVLSQRSADRHPPCPAHVAYLAACLAARGRLLRQWALEDRPSYLQPASLTLTLALEDLATAKLLAPSDTTLPALVDDVVRALEDALRKDAGDDRRGEPPPSRARAFADWLAEDDAAGHQPRPFAVFAVSRQFHFRLAQAEASELAEAQREQLLAVHVSTYVHMLEKMGLPLTHLLDEAIGVAVSPHEQLLVMALRHVGASVAAPCRSAVAAAAAAVDCLEMAVSVLSRAEREAISRAARSWEGDWLLRPNVTLAGMVNEGLTRNSSHVAFPVAMTKVEGTAQAMTLERVTLLSLIFYVLSMAYGVLSGRDPILSPALPSASSVREGDAAAPRGPVPASVSGGYEALIRYLALSQCHQRQATALTRLAALYTDRDESGAPTRSSAHVDVGDREEREGDGGEDGDRLPMPRATGGAAVALRLLHTAIHLSRLCVPAHIALARLYARRERGEDAAPLPPMAMSAYELLSHCLHGYATAFLPPPHNAATTAGAAASPEATEALPYLHRKERHPSTCFIPVELLCERSRVPTNRGHGSLLFSSSAPQHPQAPSASSEGYAAISHRSLADVYEAALHDPRASYPRQVKAAVALDAAAHLQLPDTTASPPTPRDRDDDAEEPGGRVARTEGRWGVAQVDDDSAFRSLFAAADKELSEVISLSLQESDVALRLRFHADALARRCRRPIAPVATAHEPFTAAAPPLAVDGGEARAESRERRLHRQVLQQLGLLTVLSVGRGAALPLGDVYFPTQWRSRVPEGVDVFLSELEAEGSLSP